MGGDIKIMISDNYNEICKHNDNNYNEVHELYIHTHIYNEMRQDIEY